MGRGGWKRTRRSSPVPSRAGSGSTEPPDPRTQPTGELGRPAQELLDRAAGEVSGSRRAQPLEGGGDQVGGVVDAAGGPRLDPRARGDEPPVGGMVARPAGGQPPALRPADLAIGVGYHPTGGRYRVRG